MLRNILLVTAFLVYYGEGAFADDAVNLQAVAEDTPVLRVKRCEDFQLSGKGDAQAWQAVDWVALHRRPNGQHDYDARFKMLYSDTGLYVLFSGSDKKLTATMQADFMDLWNEDVYECFFWPDERHSIYFEYEISPLGYELPILIPNLEGQFLGWKPWHYDGPRKTRRKVFAENGEIGSMSTVSGWRAEIFVPYELLKPLQNVPPKPGSQWRANFYRVDYDDQQTTQWDWARVGKSFHEFEKFGRLVFE